jgi:glycosyltransferase involved in cell wall biosynthesis
VKILVLSNLYPPDIIGGYELACAQVVDALRARGHDVLVVAAEPRMPVAPVPHVRRRFQLTDVWNSYHMGITPVAQLLHEAESRYVNAFNVHALTEALHEFPPDVVYVCNVTGLGGLGLMACLQYLQVPWVWQLGDGVPRYLCSTREGTIVPGLAREFSRRIRGHFVVVSQRLVEETESYGITLNGHVEVIPNWIVGPRPATRRVIYYQGGPLRIMSAGQVVRHKGVDILIEAAAELRRKGCDDFEVHVYGKCTDPSFLDLITHHDLRDHVVLMGSRPHAELMRLYAEYDVFAFPTEEREPFGLAPLEAAAAGCVPVITQNCGIAEWLVHGVHCLKADRTPRAFAEVFRRIADHQIDLEPLGRRGEVTAWRDFHIDTILPRIERMLVRASRQSRAGAGTAEDAYRLARMAEQMTQWLIQESLCA